MKKSHLKTLALLVSVALLGGLALAPRTAVSKSPTATVTQEKPVAAPKQAEKSDKEAPSDLADRIKTLEERERAGYMLALEGQRKIIDWWFAYLAAVTAILALSGVLIPYFMSRRDKEQIKEDKAHIQAELEKAKTLTAEILAHTKQAKDGVESVQQQVAKFKDFSSGAETSIEEKTKTAQSAQSVKENPEATEKDKLLARAVAASQFESATREQALEAFDLWKALCMLNPSDARAQFNAGYWAQRLYSIAGPNDRSRWHSATCTHYQRALSIQPDMHMAAYNWGNALNAEAKALARSDLPAARDLWQQAGHQYERALTIKPDKHEAANNWGAALNHEANALVGSDLPAARALWQQAGHQYERALNIKPDKHEATTNWGIALGTEANALAPSDLIAARALWQLAGHKCELALSMQPDMHDAVHTQGVALSNEAKALKSTDLNAANALLEKAKTLLTRHSAQSEGAAAAVAYLLACVYALQGNCLDALAQLNICIDAKTLPNHWREDGDFDLIRERPEFQAWVAKHFPGA